MSPWQDLDPKGRLFPFCSLISFKKKVNKAVKYFITGCPHTSIVWKRWSSMVVKVTWLERTSHTQRREQTWPCSCTAKSVVCFHGQREMACGLGFLVTELMAWTGKALLSNTSWIYKPFSLVFKPSSYLAAIPFLLSTKGKTCAMNKGERDAPY